MQRNGQKYEQKSKTKNDSQHIFVPSQLLCDFFWGGAFTIGQAAHPSKKHGPGCAIFFGM
jgi:hypothetical protein